MWLQRTKWEPVARIFQEAEKNSKRSTFWLSGQVCTKWATPRGLGQEGPVCGMVIKGGSWGKGYESFLNSLSTLSLPRDLSKWTDFSKLLETTMQSTEQCCWWCRWLVAELFPTLATLWTGACQAPLPMGFPRPEHWSGCHFPLQGLFPGDGTWVSCTAGKLTEPPGKLDGHAIISLDRASSHS